MSRFLSNLLARSLAPAPAIQPRLASRYEPAAGGPSASAAPGFTEEHVESLSGSPSSFATGPALSRPAVSPVASRAPASPPSSATDFTIPDFLPRSPGPRPASPSVHPAPPAYPLPSEDKFPTEGGRPPLTSPPRPPPSPREDAVRSTDSTPAFPSLFFPRRDPRPSRAPFAPASPAIEPHPPSPATSSPAPSAIPSPAQPAPPLLSPPSAPPPVSSGAVLEAQSAPPAREPSIHVSIGRVEIRAVPAPAAPSRPAASAPARRPAMPLEEYLRRRDAA